MLSVKGGQGRVRARNGHIQVPRKTKGSPNLEEREQEESSEDLPSKIVVRPSDQLHMIPRSVWAQQAFKWEPQSFATESERLNEKIIDPYVQDDSLKRWLKNPTLPVVYGVLGNPSEIKARYFAAYLAEQHVRHLQGKARVVWHSVYGGYKNELIEDYRDKDSMYEPTLIILCNLAVNSTPMKYEKTRDILERFSNVPRIVVAAGEDPLSFLSTKLYVPCNALAYFSESVVKKRLEVI